ncbi:alpha/beta fold hydrolase [Hoyosella sp. G463]|uniref:Alpha/beta fold hydrolase n=1 Tax=Lolliginicoccus lacisalsi TaxID=2742202 RepID=A0A927JDL7_9ACTN|nr:alpha/beta fold hydrolase [Lolliginicoccus lacisalsi]
MGLTDGLWGRGLAVGGAGLAVAGAAGSVAWAMQRKLIYYPDDAAVPAAHSVLPTAEEIRLNTDDGLTLDAWHVSPVPGSQPRGITVLIAHGNAGNRADRAPLAEALAREGIASLLLDYRGYGGNPGSPSEEGLALDARAAYWYLRRERSVPAERLIYFGESLGCGVMASLALRYPPAGLVLRSPFTDLASIGRVHYPYLPHGLLRDRFRVLDAVKRITVPTVVAYGTADEIIPASMSAEVADAARNLHSRVVLPGAGHNDVEMLVGATLIDAITGLLPE